MPNMHYWTYTAFMIHIFLTKIMVQPHFFGFSECLHFLLSKGNHSVLTSDNVKKSVLVLAYLFVPP